ncbi:MAG: LysR family transcriptional regulator [Burkholderiales bacterium]|nr:LysR family transcriptional regulator [Burkholderiales bacterium]
MNTKNLDLNLLRVFDAVYATRSVSRAAEQLDVTQPAVSQGLARLREALGDPLFLRAAGGMRPTARADQLSETVHDAMQALENALLLSATFDPQQARRVFRLHMTDIGEMRFLPELMTAVRKRAPMARIETQPMPLAELGSALDRGSIDLALGFLPSLKDVRSMRLFSDRYIVLLRRGHPLLAGNGRPMGLPELRQLEFATVRTHAYTREALRSVELEHRVRLTAEHFMCLPGVLRHTDLAVIMPRDIAMALAPPRHYTIAEITLPMRQFDVSIHWSRRYDADPANRWLRELAMTLFSG